MNLHCATCARPLPDEPSEHHVGGIRYCSATCIREWFADGRHRDRRQTLRPVGHDRRAS